MEERRLKCAACGSTEFETDSTRGDTFCVKCGLVVEESTIVSEVTFVEGADGSTSVVGQFLPSSGRPTYTGRSRGGLESREETIERGRRRIQNVASMLSLTQHIMDAAQRIFMLALQHGFMQGRKSDHVVAACLYIACRREKSPHMLLDFSQVLRTNVFVLGQTFLRLVRLLNLHLPLSDPSLYIHRFAAEMEFGEKAHIVAMTALKLVSRMKRDWLLTGRRPAGVCAAALLIAGRIHGFRRTQKEVVQTVRICDSTLRNRLMEFSQTPASMLTPMQFAHENEEEATQECDPPAFVRSMETKEEESKDNPEEQAALDREMMRALSSSEIVSTFGKDGIEDDSQMTQRSETEKERVKDRDGEKDDDDGDSDISGEGYLKEEELDAYLCQTEEEVEQRRRIWREMNRDYLIEQEAKQRKIMTDDRQASSASVGGSLPELRTDTTVSSSNPARPRSVTARSTLEAVQGMMEKKKLSKHIDQSTFQDIFGADASQFDSTKSQKEDGDGGVVSEGRMRGEEEQREVEEEEEEVDDEEDEEDDEGEDDDIDLLANDDD